MILNINDKVRKVYIPENRLISIVEGLDSVYDKNGGFYKSSINTSRLDKDNIDVDTRFLGSKDAILYGDGSIKKPDGTVDKRIKKFNSSERYNLYSNTQKFYEIVINFLESYRNVENKFYIYRDFCSRYDVDNFGIAGKTFSEFQANMIWVATGKQSIDDLIAKYRINYAKSIRNAESYSKPVENANNKKLNPNRIPRYRVMTVPGTSTKVIALFRADSFNFSDIIKNGEYRQDARTDKDLGISQNEREKVDGTKTQAGIPVRYDGTHKPDLLNNFSLNGDLSRRSTPYMDKKYTSISQFIDKSVMGAAYALKSEKIYPTVIVDAPSSSKFNTYYCTRLSKKLGIPYKRNFFDRDIINAVLDEDAMRRDGVTEENIIGYKKIVTSAGVNEIAYFMGQPMDRFFDKYSEYFSRIPKKKRGRGRGKKYASKEDMISDLYVSLKKALVYLKDMSFQAFSSKYQNAGIFDNLFTYFENSFKFNSDSLVDGCDENFVRREIAEIISANGRIYGDYLSSVKEMFSIYMSYRDKLLSYGVKVNFSNDRFKIVKIDGKYRKYLKNAYIVANKKEINNEKYFERFRNGVYLVFDEDISTGSTLKLLIEALGRNGVVGKNVICLTNAYSLSESINVRAIIKEAIDSVVNKGVKGVIFDFDYTLFNTDEVQEARSMARQAKGTLKQKEMAWEQAYQEIGKCIPYSGIKELLLYLQQRQIPCCVVSMCKPEFVKRALDAFGMPEMAIYGASRPYMPKSKGMSKFVASIGTNPQECISIGDRASDGAESQKAGVNFIGCSWGDGHENDSITNGMKSPIEVIKYIESINEKR